jgi:multicomponent Na+:H+ antiporter subunit B
VSRRVRFVVTGLSAVVLALGLGVGLSGLPPLGANRTAYARILDEVGLEERHARNLVTAVTFDYRAIDTLLEEVMLFAAVIGTMILLRAAWSEEERRAPLDALEAEDVGPESGAVTATSLVGGGALFAWGANIVAHGPITPGGGFQGGVAIAGALLLVYLGRDYQAFRRVARTEHLERIEALCIFALCALGFAGAIFGDAFLENVLPLGTPGRIFSSGLIAALNAVAGLGVFAGVGLLFGEFLEQTLILREGKRWP